MMSYRCIIGVLVVLSATLAHADPQRERIAAERAAAIKRFTEQERACNERFVVTSCVNAARKEQRMTLDRLHRAELVLDEAERRETAARRRQELQQRAAAQDARAGTPEHAERNESMRAEPAPNAPARPPRSASSPAEKRANEQRNEGEFEARARAAQAHREAVERRNAARAGAGKVATPLSVPSGASAP